MASANHFIAPREGMNVVAAIREIAGGADFACECAGSASAFRQAINCTDVAWGKVISVGATTELLRISIVEVMAGRQITGSLLGGVLGGRDTPTFIDWLAQDRIDLRHRSPM